MGRGMHIKDLAADRSAEGLPDLFTVVLAKDRAAVAANELLHRVVARQYLVRLLRAVRRLRTEQPAAPQLTAVAALLDAADLDTAFAWATRPDVTGWIWRSGMSGADPVGLLDRLGRCLAEEPAGAAASVPLGRHPAVPVITPGASARSAQLFDWASEGDERPLALDPARAAAFAARVRAAAEVLGRLWPEGLDTAATDIRAFAALGGHRGLRPLNFSIHGLRGLVLTSERPAYMLAQTLVHEAGHQRFSGILDCVAVVRNPTATHYSPFVDAERPLGHILHGILSFINDVHAARRCLAAEADETESRRIERYVALKTDQLRLAEKNFAEVAEPTAHGERLFEGCRAAIAGLSRD